MRNSYLTFLFLAFLLFSEREVAAQNKADAISAAESIEGLAIYPNPINSSTNTFLTIKSNLNTNKNIEFYDVLGKRIFATVLRGKQLNISQLNPGIYILKIKQ